MSIYTPSMAVCVFVCVNSPAKNAVYSPTKNNIHRVGQNHISAPYMTVCMVISLLKTVCTPYIPIIVWLWPTLNIRII